MEASPAIEASCYMTQWADRLCQGGAACWLWPAALGWARTGAVVVGPKLCFYCVM